MRLKILPFVIIICSLFVVARVAELFKGDSKFARDFIVTHSNAATAGPHEVEAPIKDGAASKDDKEIQKPKLEPVDLTKQTSNSPAEKYCSEAQLSLFNDLIERRQDLEKRQTELEKKSNILSAAEKSITEKLDKLADFKQEIQSLLKSYSDQENAKLDSLVKIYQSMKPQDAAKIFEQLDMDVILKIIDRMKESKAAPILSNMDPKIAKDITLNLANERKLNLQEMICPN